MDFINTDSGQWRRSKDGKTHIQESGSSLSRRYTFRCTKSSLFRQLYGMESLYSRTGTLLCKPRIHCNRYFSGQYSNNTAGNRSGIDIRVRVWRYTSCCKQTVRHYRRQAAHNAVLCKCGTNKSCSRSGWIVSDDVCSKGKYDLLRLWILSGMWLVSVLRFLSDLRLLSVYLRVILSKFLPDIVSDMRFLSVYMRIILPEYLPDIVSDL